MASRINSGHKAQGGGKVDGPTPFYPGMSNHIPGEKTGFAQFNLPSQTPGVKAPTIPGMVPQDPEQLP